MVSKLSRLSQVTLVSVVLVQFFFLVTASALFPTYWAKSPWPTWLPIYIALTLGTLVLASYLGGPLGDPFGLFPLVFVYFAIGLMATFFLFQVPTLRVPLNIPQGDAIPTGAFNLFVVSFGEELLFRWLLIGMLYPLLKFWSVPASAGVWALFHLAVYGESPLSVAVIFALGIVFGSVYLLTRRLAGIGAPWGAHFGWNMATTGLFSVHLTVPPMHFALAVLMIALLGVWLFRRNIRQVIRMKSLQSDVSAISELGIILIAVVVIIVLVGLIAGGIILTVGVFFGGRLGLGFFLLVIGGLAFVATMIPQLHIPKSALWIAYILLGVGLLFLILGVLGF